MFSRVGAIVSGEVGSRSSAIDGKALRGSYDRSSGLKALHMVAASDYVLSLKDNHPTLHQQVKNWFEAAQSLGFKGINVSISQRVEKGHHRSENRKVYTVPVSQLPALHEQDEWIGLTTVVMVVR